MVDQQPQVELRAGQRRRRQCVYSRGQRGPGDGDRVDLVALATLAARAPRAGHQPCRDPNHALTARDQEPLQRAGDMAAILQCPDPFTGQAARPDQQRREAANSYTDRLIAEQFAGRAIDGGDRVRALVGVRPEHDHGPRPHPFCLRMLDVQRTGLAEGAATLLSSHAEHPRPATSDTTKGGQTRRVDSLKESQLAARSGTFTSASNVTAHRSKQQASRGSLRSGRSFGGGPRGQPLAAATRHYLRRGRGSPRPPLSRPPRLGEPLSS